MKKRILTGDRPTGRLHIGHLVGTLQNRVRLQDEYECFFVIADLQVLTDHIDLHSNIEANIFEVMCDYLSVGLKPENCFFIQSQVPELCELTMYFSFLVSLASVQRNPTVKSEAEMYGVSQMSLGFVSYPVSQAADILAFNADLVPVGQDQLPHIEQAREVARTFNRTFGKKIFNLPEALVGEIPVLSGTKGDQKMSKSLNNQIDLAHSGEETSLRIGKMVTDVQRVFRKDVGHPDSCQAFKYWSIFAPEATQQVRFECEGAMRGCKECKAQLADKMNTYLGEIREKRKYYASKPNLVWEILASGTKRARQVAKQTLMEVRESMHLSFPLLKLPSD
ncbi:MAG: tryptophan--tRNA ligase [bacterium]